MKTFQSPWQSWLPKIGTKPEAEGIKQGKSNAGLSKSRVDIKENVRPKYHYVTFGTFIFDIFWPVEALQGVFSFGQSSEKDQKQVSTPSCITLNKISESEEEKIANLLTSGRPLKLWSNTLRERICWVRDEAIGSQVTEFPFYTIHELEIIARAKWNREYLQKTHLLKRELGATLIESA